MSRFNTVLHGTFIGLGLIVGVITIQSALSQPASALSTSQFSAGDIIDDSVFFNSSSMSAADVQNFLNAQVPSCDTNGNLSTSYYYNSGTGRVSFSSNDGSSAWVTTTRAIFGQRYNSYTGRSDGGVPFTCLRDYNVTSPSMSAEVSLCNAYAGGTKSAAQTILDIAQSCNINPQVLLVLLEKEQGLVTDTWPQGIQYGSATGYAFPDSGSCNPAYAGLFNQVYYAARQYKLYAKNISSYAYQPGTTVNILYNPSTSCGSSPVFIQNQATANLYIYTPYQPNAAALAASPGTVVNCGAYGNLNFWRTFNNWFGPSIGPLVKTSTSGDLYYSDGITKYRVTSMDLAAEYGLGVGNVRTVSQASIDALGTPGPSPYLTNLVKSTSDTDADGGSIYFISNGKRYLISSMAQLTAFGFNTNQISYLDYSQLLRLPLATLQNFVRGSNGFVYSVSNGAKQGIFEGSLFSSLDPSGNVSDLGAYGLNTIPTGRALISSKMILKDQSGGIWFATSTGWYQITSMDVFACWGLSTSNIVSFTPDQTTTDNSLGYASCAVSDGTGNNYLLDGTKRYTIDPSWGFSAPTLTTINTALLPTMTTVTSIPTQVFRTTSNGSLYVLENAKKRHIYNMDIFTKNGYLPANIIDVSSSLANSITVGPEKLATGYVMIDNSTGRLYATINNTRYYISSMQQFANFGFNSVAIVQTSAADILTYTDGSSLAQIYTIGGTSYLADTGVAWNIPDAIKAHWGVSGSTPAYTARLPVGGVTSQTASRFIISSSNPTVYYLENGLKRPVTSWATFVSLGGSNANLMVLSDSTLSLFTTGASI